MFDAAKGMFYVNFLHALHERFLFDWFLEIGCRNGRVFAPVRCKTIAVDPSFKIEMNAIGTKPVLYVRQQTSDEFFESGFLEANKIALSFSFLDGMHLFEYLLRDFINAERHSDCAGVIAMHDCCPFSHAMTSRDWETMSLGGSWTGDVWKLIPILQEYRPDLTITVLDCADTGLVLISGLKPANRVLQDRYDEIVARYQALDLERHGAERFYGSFTYTDARQFAAAGFPLFAGVGQEHPAGSVPKRAAKRAPKAAARKSWKRLLPFRRG